MSERLTDEERALREEDGLAGRATCAVQDVIVRWRQAETQLRRLRSDEWLERCAGEIAIDSRKGPGGVTRSDTLATLKRHRDGV